MAVDGSFWRGPRPRSPCVWLTTNSLTARSGIVPSRRTGCIPEPIPGTLTTSFANRNAGVFGVMMTRSRSSHLARRVVPAMNAPIGATFAPFRAHRQTRRKNTEKMALDMLEKWRGLALFQGSRRHFFRRSGVNGHGAQRAHTSDLTSANARCNGRPAAWRFGNPAPFFFATHPGCSRNRRADPDRLEFAGEIRAVCSSQAARRRIGRKHGHRPTDRSAMESPGDPRPEKGQSCLGSVALYRSIVP